MISRTVCVLYVQYNTVQYVLGLESVCFFLSMYYVLCSRPPDKH